MNEEKKMLEMRKLRLLKIYNVLDFSECGYLSNELRVLEWHQYPLIYMPSSFQPKNLVELNMSNSRIERLWDQETTLSLEKLILLDLSNCEYLVEAPDFSRVPSLERLILEGCKRISKIHPTFKELSGLKLLNLKGCESLESFPQGICFKFLEIFILSGCKKLDRFPEIVGDMNCLIQLFLDGTAIKELPTSVERLSNLKLLDLRECKNLLSLPDLVCSLTSLEGLSIGGCSMINQLPVNIGSLEKLEQLHACRTAIRKAPSSIVLLKNLQRLCFSQCGGVADGSSSQCSSESNISFKLPKSFSGLSSLTYLDLTECNLEQGEIPKDIGCLSLLESLKLGGNNFTNLPDSISQLSKLRYLNVNNCSKLQSLTNLPLNVKEVRASDCPMLNDQMIIWPSDKGFSFIDCRKSVQAERSIAHHPLPMPEEHIPTLFPKFIQDRIYHGGRFQIRFRYARIPDWCSRWNKGSSLRIRLPDKNSSQTWIGFALFVVFLIKKQENFHIGRYNTFCEFYTDEGCLENPCELESFDGFLVGSYGLCVYVPKARFANQLDKASHIKASISTNRPDLEVLKFGLHVIYDKDVPKFTQDLVDTSNEHLNMNSIKHYMHILEKATELERSGDVLDLRSDPSPRNQVFGTLHPTSQLRIVLQNLLSRIFFEGSLYTRNVPIPFSFPSTGFASGWFFHQSVGRNVVCYLPANIVDDKSWIGFSLYATLKMSPSDFLKNYSDSKTARPLLHIDLHSHGSSISHITTLDGLPIMPYSHQLLLFHVPRVFFKQELNQSWGVSALFRTSIPNVEVERCGIRAVYEKDLGNVIELITECRLNSLVDEQVDEQSCYQAYEMLVENIIDTFQFVELETRRQEMPVHSSYSSQRKDESLQTNMFVLITQDVDKEISTAYNKLTIPLDPIVFHSKQDFMESSYKLFEESSSRDSKLGLIHLQIMVETPLFENDLTRWKSNLDYFLKRHFCLHIFITLSLKGRIISLLKPFDPFSPYNLCFPRKEILEWFGDYQVNERRMGIGLPPNLKTDKDWRGIAVCVAFSVQEHPNAILDNDNSQVSFRLLCHMNTDEGCCLNPVPMFRITKDKFKWSCVRGFIWLTYIPSSLLLAELHGQSYIVIDIYNECPGLFTQNLGVRLLFEQDVEEFRQSITKCITGFFDNLDPVCQFMASESDPKNFGKTAMGFDQDMIYNSCFPPIEIPEWFSNHYSSSHSVITEIPTDLYSDDNCLGVALCAYFSSGGKQPSTHVDDFDPEMPHNLICNFDLNFTHHFQITVEELEKIHIGNQFVWLSYIPRHWFSDQLKHCSFIEASFASDRQGFLAHKCGVRVLYKHDEKELKETINHCMAIGYSIRQMEQLAGFQADKAEIPTHAVKKEPICQIKSGRDFDRGLIYSSCFPLTEIVDWFNHHISGPSLEIQPLSNLFGDDNWTGLALCVHFSDPEHPTTFPDKFDPDFSHYLVCLLETERVTLGPLHQHEISNQEFKKLGNGEFIWLSYIPRLWFSEQLEGSFDLIKASFASDRGGWRAEKCGLRLLFRHDEEEFKQTINHCMALLIENQDPISQNKFDNEENKKQCHDGQAGTSKSSRFVPDPQQEILEEPGDLNQKNRGKRIV
ncbi:uncharacterized protein LOC107417594 isoform X1 [Ziziphus jujuba]|uniref:Uncharacterized protein LOC107417594 isoform X1 n=1 Tax=Ziziphus jujuba TaxID=326968 RepID=A0ABM3I0R1_ZIZJJ|nr:uncharacterized protein LOC107417594 isoform X1 [Ziziphus jujuba]